MKKPTVYLDTNAISAYCYRGKDLKALARRAITVDWWENERVHFGILASVVTERELSTGLFARQAECYVLSGGYGTCLSRPKRGESPDNS